MRRFRYFLPTSAERLADGAGVLPNLRRSWLARLQAPSYMLAFRAAASSLLKRGGFNAVNSHWLVPSAWAAAPGARRAGARHILSIHAADVFLLRRLPGGKSIAARIIREAAAIFTDSTFITDQISEVVGFKVAGVPTTAGVNAAAFAPRHTGAVAKRRLGWPGAPTVLFVGRMVEKKGLPYLLAAMAEVRTRAPYARLVVVGDGPEHAAAEAQAENLKLTEAVAFVDQEPRRPQAHV